jgi:hypothetical protein
MLPAALSFGKKSVFSRQAELSIFSHRVTAKAFSGRCRYMLRVCTIDRDGSAFLHNQYRDIDRPRMTLYKIFKHVHKSKLKAAQFYWETPVLAHTFVPSLVCFRGRRMMRINLFIVVVGGVSGGESEHAESKKR